MEPKDRELKKVSESTSMSSLLKENSNQKTESKDKEPMEHLRVKES